MRTYLPAKTKSASASPQSTMLQRYASQPAAPTSAPPLVNEALRSPSQPLEAATRAYFETRFGHDFSRVRVHTDSCAAESARSVNALAYTVGRDIVMGAGQYQPHTGAGQRLLAHELTHVVQNGGDVASLQPQSISQPQDALEREADMVARKVGQGVNVADPTRLTTPKVQRAVGDEDALFQRPRNLTRRERPGGPFSSTLPYREATELIECVRIMGEQNAAYCRQQVLGEPLPEQQRRQHGTSNSTASAGQPQRIEERVASPGSRQITIAQAAQLAQQVSTANVQVNGAAPRATTATPASATAPTGTSGTAPSSTPSSVNRPAGSTESHWGGDFWGGYTPLNVPAASSMKFGPFLLASNVPSFDANFALVRHDIHPPIVPGAVQFDIFRDPNVISLGISLPRADITSTTLTLGASVDLFNLLFRLHGRDFIEWHMLNLGVAGGFDSSVLTAPMGTLPSGTSAFSWQEQAGTGIEIHITPHFSYFINFSATFTQNLGSGIWNVNLGPFTHGLLLHVNP